MERHDLMLIVAALLGFAALLLRRLSTDVGRVGAFLHSPLGAVLMTVASAAIGSVAPLLQAGAPPRDLVLGGISAATAALLGVSSSAPKEAAVTLRPAAPEPPGPIPPPLVALLVLLLPSLVFADIVKRPDVPAGSVAWIAWLAVAVLLGALAWRWVRRMRAWVWWALALVALPSIAFADDAPPPAPVRAPLVLPTIAAPDPAPVPAMELAGKLQLARGSLDALALQLGVPMPAKIPVQFWDTPAGKGITITLTVLGGLLAAGQTAAVIYTQVR